MKTQFQGDLYVCDGCGKQEVIEKNDLPPQGYHGVVNHDGSHAWDWYACKKTCVTRAIWASQERDLNDDQEPS